MKLFNNNCIFITKKIRTDLFDSQPIVDEVARSEILDVSFPSTVNKSQISFIESAPLVEMSYIKILRKIETKNNESPQTNGSSQKVISQIFVSIFK